MFQKNSLSALVNMAGFFFMKAQSSKVFKMNSSNFPRLLLFLQAFDSRYNEWWANWKPFELCNAEREESGESPWTKSLLAPRKRQNFQNLSCVSVCKYSITICTYKRAPKCLISRFMMTQFSSSTLSSSSHHS